MLRSKLRKARKRFGAWVGLSPVPRSPKFVPVNLVPRSSPSPGVPADFLTVVAIMRDEADYLEEWVAFHRLRGVDRFLLYDNESKDDPAARLAPWIDAGIVRIIPWPSFLRGTNAQHLAYGHACRVLAGQSSWVAFLDIDEFLFSPRCDRLPEALAGFDEEAAVAVFLRCFGPDRHEARPSGLVIENYHTRLADTHWENRQYKTILRPENVEAVVSAQRFRLGGGARVVNERGETILHSTRHDHVSELLRINHYATRSIEEFERKLARRYFWSERRDTKRREEKRRQHVHLMNCAIVDDDVDRFVPELRAALRRGPQ